MQDHPNLKDWWKCACGYSCNLGGKNIMISRDEVLMNRDKEFPLSPELETNLTNLLVAVNKLRTLYGKAMTVSSGYRPGHYNKDAGGALNSPHVECLAIDVFDADGIIWNWVLLNLKSLKDFGLYMEDKRWCKGWVHFQYKKPISGNRIFIPTKGNPPHPELWDGIYDYQYNS